MIKAKSWINSTENPGTAFHHWLILHMVIPLIKEARQTHFRKEKHETMLCFNICAYLDYLKTANACYFEVEL